MSGCVPENEYKFLQVKCIDISETKKQMRAATSHILKANRNYFAIF